MAITVEGRPEEVTENLVRPGRYASAQAAVSDIVPRFNRYEQVFASISASLAGDEGMSEAEFDAEVAATIDKLWRDRLPMSGDQSPGT